jgi:monovalent cation:H+ antiporter-2, CPA2 family
MALGLTALKVTALVAFTAVVGTRVIPRVLDYVADTRSRELFTLTVLVIALGIAVGSALIFSVSMALGAFLAGMVVGRSEYSLPAASEALPMRDAFAVLFFVSVGMLLDPGALVESPGLVIGALGVVLIGKPLVALFLVWAMKYPFRAALTVGIGWPRLASSRSFSRQLAENWAFSRPRRRTRSARRQSPRSSSILSHTGRSDLLSAGWVSDRACGPS